ncbi:hypothetical protein FFLO_00242 [Filobasidium floriforme]|uniref:Amino acid transporter transmembrane domain-containing protein n=1 Tax=Filobasidium floriforme TaxID=5210 RepID=A0A8K0JSJ4_9TREE|nr:transmembrane amino acid transporter protein-domain-containing protein [Filobasidium floriforme]KAG7575423.1 hypothetical protein FFLO_00242 [Filobasidium floriforme]KAH8082557.1 transmembrane amino acid transporter protein-domain-containing protein [Filobasidium floriforme]
MVKTDSRVFQVTKVTGDDESSEMVEIRERSLTLVQATSLLLVEYVVLAILAFPWSYSILGMAGGIITTMIVAACTLYTSLILWRYCMRHPHIRDIADVAYELCGKSRIAWTAAFIGLALNNIFIMGLHVNAGTVAINTLGYTFCSALWGLIIGVIMYAGSLVRGFSKAEFAAAISAGTMLLCFFFVVIGHGIQDHPNGFINEMQTPTKWTVWAPEGTTFVQGISALLNIIYTFTGQALIPSFVGDMKNPEEFPTALYISMSVEVLLFTICGAVVYSTTGPLATTPGYGSLTGWFRYVAAALTLPTIIIVGMLYSLVTSRALFFQIFSEKSIHRRTHTVKGWGTWVGIVTAIWVLAYIIGEAIPFFSDLLSVISSLFGSWFGFIFWGSAYLKMNRGKPFRGLHAIESIIAVILIGVGIFILGVGTYASVQSIINSYATGSIKSPFSCSDNGF